jgi:general secretion pathway protein G
MRRLIYIPILLGLGAIFIPKLGDFGVSTQTKVAQNDIYELKRALELFRADVNTYPTTQEGLAALVHRPSTV